MTFFGEFIRFSSFIFHRIEKEINCLYLAKLNRLCRLDVAHLLHFANGKSDLYAKTPFLRGFAFPCLACVAGWVCFFFRGFKIEIYVTTNGQADWAVGRNELTLSCYSAFFLQSRGWINWMCLQTQRESFWFQSLQWSVEKFMCRKLIVRVETNAICFEIYNLLQKVLDGASFPVTLIFSQNSHDILQVSRTEYSA